MAKEIFVAKKFRGASLDLIERSNAIIANYQAQGLKLTLRQLYYRLVASAIIANRPEEYNKLGNVINDARLAGLIDWEAIEDRTRNVEINPHWEAPSDIIYSASRSYRNDLWRNQPYRPEVWVEKDALEGVVESACRPLDVPFFSCRGYTSQTAMYDAGKRLLKYRRNVWGGSRGIGEAPLRQTPIIFHLGDHDPSGIDMSRDIQDRLELFTGRRVKFQRLALNKDQIDTYNPPPNPAKSTDSRFAGYLSEHGDESWELDALEPAVLVALIRNAIFSIRDKDRWDDAVREQELGRAQLNAMSSHYEDAAAAVEEHVVMPEIEDDEEEKEEEDDERNDD